jgi:hypothetical protein
MLGTKAKCPNVVFKVVACLVSQGLGEGIRELVSCGDEHYDIIDPRPFSEDSGIDPLAILVRCKSCGCEYYIFPALKYREVGAK